MRRRSHLAGLTLAFVLTGAAGLSGQATLTPGTWVEGTLEGSDPRDEEGYVYDAFGFPEGFQGLARVTVESGDFDTLLQWGVMGGGRYLLVAQNDDFPGLAASTDSRAYAVVGPGERPEIRVLAWSAEGAGAYRVRMDPVASGDVAPESIAYGADFRGDLREGDVFTDGSFQDRFRFQGAEGDVVKMVLEADFDAYLELWDAAGELLAEDDDSFGGTDAWLEIALPADGTYEIRVTAYEPETGAYRLRMGPDLDVAPDPGAGPVAFTDEERNGLQVSPQEVWNDALGFSFPSPGADFTLMDQSEVDAVMGGGAPNVHMWMFQDVMETAELLVMTIRAPEPPDAATVQLIGSMMTEATGGVVLEEQLDWEATRSMFLRFEIPEEEEEAELRCTASGPDRVPGLIVCLIGTSRDGWSFRETMAGLEIR